MTNRNKPESAVNNYIASNKTSVQRNQIKILRIFRIVGHPRNPKGEDHGYLTTFRGINAPKSGPFKYENNAQTLPKQLQNNFEKVQKSTFLTPKMVKNEPSNRPK